MTAYTPDPSAHVLDANLGLSSERARPGMRTKEQRHLRAVAPFRLWLLGLVFFGLFCVIGAKIFHLAVVAEARGPLKVIEYVLDGPADASRLAEFEQRPA